MIVEGAIILLFLFFFMKVMKPLPKPPKNDFGKLDFKIEGFR